MRKIRDRKTKFEKQRETEAHRQGMRNIRDQKTESED